MSYVLAVSLLERNEWREKGIRQLLQLPLLMDDISHWFGILSPDLKMV